MGGGCDSTKVPTQRYRRKGTMLFPGPFVLRSPATAALYCVEIKFVVREMSTSTLRCQ